MAATRLVGIGWGVALAAALAATGGAQAERFVVGIVRLDGRIVPLAAYDAGAWERAWPEADRTAMTTAIDATASVWTRRGDPVPRVWRVWPASGAPAVQAEVSGVEVVDAHCEKQIALTTNLPPAEGEHVEKFGLASDIPNLSVIAVTSVGRTVPLWGTAERTVRASFSRLETAEATRRHWQLPRESPQPLVQVTALYGQINAPRSPLYFVAEKKYRSAGPVGDADCHPRTVVTGWLIPTETGTYMLRNPGVFLTDCDGKEVLTAVPLSALRVSGRLFWVLVEHGYEDETYRVVEIGQSGISDRIEVNGGGC